MNISYTQKSTMVPKATESKSASVLDYSMQKKSLQRKADMANDTVQRVVQRLPGDEEKHGFPIDTFVYKDAQNDDLIYEEGGIAFTEYKENLKSSGFTGCMMMAFKFKQPYTCKKIDGNKKRVDPAVNYIAHVYCSNDERDTKKTLYDAEQSGLITIEVLIKPNNPNVYKKIDDTKVFPQLIGVLKLSRTGWSAEVKGKTQSKTSLGEEKIITEMDVNQTNFETLATKALVYASILSCENLDRESYWNVYAKLEDFAKSNSDSLISALNLTFDKKCKKIIVRALKSYTTKTLDEIKNLIVDDETKKIIEETWNSESQSASAGSW